MEHEPSEAAWKGLRLPRDAAKIVAKDRWDVDPNRAAAARPKASTAVGAKAAPKPAANAAAAVGKAAKRPGGSKEDRQEKKRKPG